MSKSALYVPSRSHFLNIDMENRAHKTTHKLHIGLTSFILRGVYSDTTQLNSTELNSDLSMNVVTQLTQFVGRDVINKNTTDLAVRCSTGSVEFS